MNIYNYLKLIFSYLHKTQLKNYGRSLLLEVQYKLAQISN